LRKQRTRQSKGKKEIEALRDMRLRAQKREVFKIMDGDKTAEREKAPKRENNK